MDLFRLLTGAITPSAWASCPSQRKLSQKIKPDHSKPSMLLYRNINPALKCEAPQGPKPSDCLGRMDAGRAAAGQGKAGIVFSWARQLWNCSGSHTSLEQRHLPVPTWIPGGDERTHRARASAGNCNSRLSAVPLELRWHRELPRTLPTDPPLRALPWEQPGCGRHGHRPTAPAPPESQKVQLLGALWETEGQRQGWERQDEAAGAAGIGSCSSGLWICPDTRNPRMHKQSGNERDKAGREQSRQRLESKGIERGGKSFPEIPVFLLPVRGNRGCFSSRLFFWEGARAGRS